MLLRHALGASWNETMYGDDEDYVFACEKLDLTRSDYQIVEVVSSGMRKCGNRRLFSEDSSGSGTWVL